MVGVVEGSAAFYWLISTHKLEQPSDWLISPRGTRVGLWQQGGGRLLKFLGEADESTEITNVFYRQAGHISELATPKLTKN